MASIASEGAQRLTVAILAQDADDALIETINSAQSVADEILVLDVTPRGSAVEMARAAGAVTPSSASDCDLQDDPAAARNLLLQQATGDWILWLEPGETLDVETPAKIEEFLRAGHEPITLYRVLVTVRPRYGLAACEQQAMLRLTPRQAAIRFQGRVREQVVPQIPGVDLDEQRLGWRFWRSSQDHDPEFRRRRALSEMRRAKMQLAENGESAVPCLTLGECLANLGATEAAASQFRTATRLAERGSTEMLEAYYGLLATLDGQAGMEHQRMNVCLEALEVFPLDAQLLCGMGSYLLEQSRIELATRSYRLAMEHGSFDACTWHLDDITAVSTHSLALALQLDNRDDEALQVLQSALERDPNSSRIRRGLINLHIKHGRGESALAEFEALPIEPPQREALRSAIRGALLAAEQQWSAAQAYLETAFRAGCHDTICLRWLVLTYLSTAQAAQAQQVLAVWEQTGADRVELLSYREAVSQLHSSADDDSVLPPAEAADGSPARHRVDSQSAPGERPVWVPGRSPERDHAARSDTERG